MLLFKDNFRRKMVGFDYQSVLIGTYFEKKGFSIIYEVTGSERERKQEYVCSCRNTLMPTFILVHFLEDLSCGSSK